MNNDTDKDDAMASKKTAKKTTRKTPPPVPGIPREHRMIDARAEREAVKRAGRKGGA